MVLWDPLSVPVVSKRSLETLERERKKGKASFLFLSFMLQFVITILFELMSDPLFFCSPNVSQILRKVEANHLVKMWYGFPLFVLSVVCSSSTSLALFICDVLMLVVCAVVSLFFFLGGSSTSYG